MKVPVYEILEDHVHALFPQLLVQLCDLKGCEPLVDAPLSHICLTHAVGTRIHQPLTGAYLLLFD
jgi:hypothetical protein